MKTVFLWLILLNTIVAGVYASEPEVLWCARFPDSGGSVVWDTVEMPSGGYIGVGEVSNGSSSESVLSISRIDSDGLVLWENNFLSLGNASAFSIEALSGYFVICGQSSDSLGKHGLVFKIDSSGNTIWSIDVGYETDDALLDLCLTPEGNIIATGYSFNSETSDNDILAVCISSTGTLLWRKRYVAPGYQTAYCVMLSSDSTSEYIITGADNGDVFLMKIGAEGNWLWRTTHILEGVQSGRSVTASAEGGYIVAGSTRERDGFSDVLLVFYDRDGEVLSDYVWGTDGPDNAYCVQDVLPAGFVVLLNSNTGTGDGYRSHIIRFDPWLSVIWSVKVLERDALCYSLLQTPDGGFVVSGKCMTTEGSSDYSSCLVKLSAEDLFHWD